MKKYGHMWYGDQCLGTFIHRMEKTLSAPLFAVTGDHWSRRFLNKNPNIFERNAVPLVLYGPDVLNDKFLPENALGSHIDIAPTLIELAAPQGFTYHCLGRNIFADDAVPVSIGTKFVTVTPEFIIENPENRTMEPFPEIGNPEQVTPVKVDVGALIKRAREYYAIGWWRVMRGAVLPE
jgi:phosphoglycerol transferase MdoB-like AlkP superfamily enzyme